MWIWLVPPPKSTPSLAPFKLSLVLVKLGKGRIRLGRFLVLLERFQEDFFFWHPSFQGSLYDMNPTHDNSKGKFIMFFCLTTISHCLMPPPKKRQFNDDPCFCWEDISRLWICCNMPVATRKIVHIAAELLRGNGTSSSNGAMLGTTFKTFGWHYMKSRLVP